ncbi:Myb-like_DNA-binding domain-containing protein [Hexamita inflata]|uniref:Myb-like DNA-binding domain-containing protein n=1 Tax=Hexamita inflata TaxID=28002 RepID=A0AA86R1I0_9EUKA|nr:Myb-like DNA-binding domain-containing protein [Hexamita inflata]CAI9954998.1 Myb-like DNA-binding domain-containing protein [Hexamita inflata]CAI9965241.1 Myb-like DNA-binding domain-containing protein [Hexamita inflata]
MNDLFVNPKSASQQKQRDDKKQQYHTWTTQEEQDLKDTVTKYGKDWQKIHQYVLPHLQPVQIKNKYYTLVKRTSMSESSSRQASDIEQSKPEDRPEKKEEKKEELEPWTNFTVFDHPDFLNFDDFLK